LHQARRETRQLFSPVDRGNAWRALPFRIPAMAHAALLADARFILEEDA